MRTSLPVALCAVLALCPACGGGDDGVDIVGDTPDEAADEISDATCDKQVDCGVWEISLELDDQGNVTNCTPAKVEVDHDECVAENRPDVREDLECAMPTDEEAEMINDCINDLVDQDCITQDEVDAYCDAIVAGEDPDEPGEQPPSCDVLDDILTGCEA
jgi:hypothetical protein